MTTTKRIDKLTKEQEALMPVWRDRWIARGLNTEPANRQIVEEGIRACYRLAKLDAPNRIIWVQSPMVACVAGPIAAYLIALAKAAPRGSEAQVGSAVYSAVYSAVDSAVHSAVSSAVSSAVYSAVDSAVSSAVYSAVDSAVHSAVHSAVSSAVHSAVHSAVSSAVSSAVYSAVDSAVHSAVSSAVSSAVGSAVDSAVRSAVHSDPSTADPKLVESVHKAILDTIARSWAQYMGGQFWANWPAWMTFFVDACKLDIGAELKERLAEFVKTSGGGWWWPHKDFCLVSETPAEIRRDESGRLHNGTGMAIRFRDGWGIHSWHGTRLPPRVIEEPESYTADEIRKLGNSEIVRALAERIGWDEFLKKLGAKVIDTWRDPRTALTYELIDTDRFGEQQPRLLRMQSPVLLDSTQPSYIEEVPPEIKTARAARAWQFMKPDGSWPSIAEANKHTCEPIFSKEA